jgi:hypothetical protein
MSQSFYEYNSSKEYLARLIATENISVVRSATFSTASFDPKARVMHMPIWRTSEEVYDLLTIHEMAHALYTPAQGWHTAVERDPNLKSYLNIIEDARIERMIKRRFAGAANTFRDGYARLMEDDFFGIKKHNIDVNTASLIDRINCYYKIGSLVHVPFKDEERHWLTQIDGAETWEDVERIARALYDYAKDQAQTNQAEEQMQIETGSKKQRGDAEEIESDESSQEDSIGRQASVDGVTSLTDKEYRERMDGLENNAAQKGTQDEFLTIGKIQLKDWVIPAKRTRSLLDNAFSAISGVINTKTNEMLSEQTATINTMVKEFEAKKRATSFARNQYSKSGRLDMKKLAKYQLAEDIFRRNVIEHKGKNHSMVMIVDWSGSMSNQIIDTVIQTINLAMFCRKVGIPFSVQIFANAIPSFSTGKPASVTDGNTVYSVHNDVTMYEMMSSDTNAAEFKHDVANFYALAVYHGRNYWDTDSPYKWMNSDNVNRSEDFKTMSLNGTPLNAALFITAEFVQQFRARHKSEVTNIIVLTDGDSGGNRNCSWRGGSTHYFDAKTGVTYRSARGQHAWETHFMYDLIRDRNHGHVNIIGYYISSAREALHTAKQWTGDYTIKMKNGFYAVNKTKTFRADRFFIVSNKNIVVNDEWDFDNNNYTFDDTPQTPNGNVPPKKVVKDYSAVVKDLKKSFKDHMGSKRDSRVVLAKFIEDIAAKII